MKKLKSLKHKIILKLKSIKIKQNIKKVLDKIIKLYKKSSVYLFLFLSLFLLDISTRIATNSIGFVSYYELDANLFSLLWIFLIIFLVKNLKKVYGKVIYSVFYLFSFIMFLVHNIYYLYFKIFFDFSLLTAVSEGSAYFLDALKDIKPWMYIVIFFSLISMILTLKKFPHNEKTNFRNTVITIVLFLSIHTILPITFGKATTQLEWNAWGNKRNVYNSFNDNNKSMQLVGLFEYNVRNIYVNFLRHEDSSDTESLLFLENIFNTEVEDHINSYTGLFEGKNLILLQLESIDNFLTTEEIMPNLSSLRKNSINFLDHYSFVNGGGSTFNSEFMVNTGYATPYTYNRNAYTFSKNNFDYSLPNIFKSVGYTVNAFHMNSSEYYSRGVNYKNFGYNSYNGLKDLGVYENSEYELDRELILNETFNAKIFNVENPNAENFVSYIITYSAHKPFTKERGVCRKLLSDEEIDDPNYNPTELDCLKIQAKETDDMIGLLIENLKEKGLYDNTVIAVFADHYTYTLTDTSIFETFGKDTETNLINKTDFFIWSSDISYKEVTKVTSQLNILPTLLNLFNLYDHPNYYVGSDALDDNYSGYVFFNDYSWYDGKRYVNHNGEVIKGLRATEDYINLMSERINELIRKNDEVLKNNYFKVLKNNKNSNT